MLGCTKALNVPVIELLGSEDQESNGRKKWEQVPPARFKRLFEAASQFPRGQQEKLTAFLEAFVNQHATR